MVARLLVTRGWGFVLTLLLIAHLSGCGGTDRARVTGKVTRHDGTPLAGARVIASSEATGKSANAQTDADGTFQLGGSELGDGVPSGEYAVAIVESRGDTDIRPPATIAAKYQTPSTSGISLIVEPGKSQNLELTLDAP